MSVKSTENRAEKGYSVSIQLVAITVIVDLGTKFPNLSVLTSTSAKMESFAQKMACVRILQVRVHCQIILIGTQF